MSTGRRGGFSFQGVSYNDTSLPRLLAKFLAQRQTTNSRSKTKEATSSKRAFPTRIQLSPIAHNPNNHQKSIKGEPSSGILVNLNCKRPPTNHGQEEDDRRGQEAPSRRRRRGRGRRRSGGRHRRRSRGCHATPPGHYSGPSPPRRGGGIRRGDRRGRCHCRRRRRGRCRHRGWHGRPRRRPTDRPPSAPRRPPARQPPLPLPVAAAAAIPPIPPSVPRTGTPASRSSRPSTPSTDTSTSPRRTR